jgi:nitroimidazol reductase NimA-like FMN-containing flavoprotein (pyridoxamine 5'-phosphate oxidase superfamily)
VLHAILDAGLLAHVGVVDASGQPYVLPVGYARDGERVLFHGSTASRLFLALAQGAPTCFTVTLLDGLVVARSLFESSMHYRGVMVLGHCEKLRDEDKLQALDVISDHLMPGRRLEARGPSKKELAATNVLALSLEEASVKVSAGPPDDAEEDLDLPIWAGVVPLNESWGAPVDAPDLASPRPVPAYVRAWSR